MNPPINISRRFLEMRVKQVYCPELLRHLALSYLKGLGGQTDLKRGKYTLILAAYQKDRGAGWLLALYSLHGKYGFEQDYGIAQRWAHVTERRLKSDAELIYDDAELHQVAIRRYQIWSKTRDRYFSKLKS